MAKDSVFQSSPGIEDVDVDACKLGRVGIDQHERIGPGRRGIQGISQTDLEEGTLPQKCGRGSGTENDLIRNSKAIDRTKIKLQNSAILNLPVQVCECEAANGANPASTTGRDDASSLLIQHPHRGTVEGTLDRSTAGEARTLLQQDLRCLAAAFEAIVEIQLSPLGYLNGAGAEMLRAIESQPTLFHEQGSLVNDPSIQIDLSRRLSGDKSSWGHLNGCRGCDRAEIGTTQFYRVSQNNIASRKNLKISLCCMEP
ncbi:hypothetical protein [Cyanobium sp. NIES-981]|uniref:hypothetical protein n=1 Tax=Cyanobium sp. NIES-981 TaxID=1851505 RepID=UPI001CEC84BC|nr:hypothetical protein [Cyanobium sp. NIES-981]